MKAAILLYGTKNWFPKYSRLAAGNFAFSVAEVTETATAAAPKLASLNALLK